MEHSAGCVTFKVTDRGPLFALMLDRFGRWAFPKGHIESGERTFAAARRELREEAGLAEIELITRLGESRHSFMKDGRRAQKRTEWFLVQAKPDAELRAARDQGAAEAGWFDFSEAFARLGYANLRPLLRLARSIVSEVFTAKA